MGNSSENGILHRALWHIENANMAGLVGYLRSERYKLVVDTLTAAVGFFLALFANSIVEDYKERQVATTLLVAVVAEAKSNEDVLTKSIPLRNGGLVLRQFSTTVAEQVLSNPAFVRHASAATVSLLEEYVRDLKLSNSYRADVEALRLKDELTTDTSKGWLGALQENWDRNIASCTDSMARVEKLTTP